MTNLIDFFNLHGNLFKKLEKNHKVHLKEK
jgi:hypothetical protein